MRNTSSAPPSEPSRKKEKKERVYTQEDIDLIDAQYREKEERYEKFVKKTPNPILEQYRKSLIKEEPNFDRDTIIFDKTTGKWKIVKEKELENNTS